MTIKKNCTLMLMTAYLIRFQSRDCKQIIFAEHFYLKLLCTFMGLVTSGAKIWHQSYVFKPPPHVA